ncbi:MAG TPA: cytosine deaminase, partial [Candidatus Synoicihabitans sp.]|nr:cytosine deaminase [Candidatus Synoicihabitans sp.]
GAARTDLGGALVLPGLLDVHVHLDKCHTWERAPNRRGEFWDALEALRADSVNWTPNDLYRRAGFGLRQAWSHGTVAMRTHIDSDKVCSDDAHAVLQQLKAEWQGRIELQTVSLCDLRAFSGPRADAVLELSQRHHATALGGFPQPNAELPRQLDALLSAARELGLGLDLHIDESGLADAECLRATAEAVLRNEFPYPVVCGHCCSLARQSSERAKSTIDLVRAAGIAVVTLPLCNLYLQDRRWRQTPNWRGLTLVHELLDAGVTVASGSDNVRDAFYAWGDFDVLEVFQQSVRIGHLDTRMHHAPALVTTAPAAIMGLPDHGRVAPGARADLVVCDAHTFNELLARPTQPRRLIHGETFRAREALPLARLQETSRV